MRRQTCDDNTDHTCPLIVRDASSGSPPKTTDDSFGAGSGKPIRCASRDPSGESPVFSSAESETLVPIKASTCSQKFRYTHYDIVVGIMRLACRC